MSSSDHEGLPDAASVSYTDKIRVDQGGTTSRDALLSALKTLLEGDFLLLDASNDPITGSLEIAEDTNASLYLHATGAGGERFALVVNINGLVFRDQDNGQNILSIVQNAGANLLTLIGGKVGVNTVSPATELDVNGDISVGGSNNELRWYEGVNYVGFEAPALTGNQIWALPAADAANPGDLLGSDAAGQLGWYPGFRPIETTFDSPSGTSGTFYFRGYYDFASSDNDFNPSINFGTANVSYAAHFFIVANITGATPPTISVTGTSITDAGVRTTSDSESISVTNGLAGAYYETTKKWIGQVTVEKIDGDDLLCNYGWCKYFDLGNRDFAVNGCEATWLGGANDTGIDIRLRHHKASGWTYNAGAAPTPPAAIASLQGDHVTEYQCRNGEQHAWKRTNLASTVLGSSSEGIILEVVTTANKAVELGNFTVEVVPAES